MRIMNNDNKTLHTAELESLATAFFDCRLDRHEETDLARILAFSDIHTPLLDQCRRAMGLEATLRRSARHKRTSRRMWIPAAASVAILAAVATAVFIKGYETSGSYITAEVYLSGKRITDTDLAISLATRDMEHELQEFKLAMEDARLQQLESSFALAQAQELIKTINNNPSDL